MAIRRLLVVGIDGATWSLLEPWIAAGHLPNLAALRTRGVSGPLQSTIQPLSAPAWVTFLTGADPGNHGVYGFVRRKPGTYSVELTNSRSCRVPTLFEYLGQVGYRVASVNVPMTYPVWPVNGVMIAGPFAPSVGPAITYPPELWADLERAVPGYDILPDFKPRETHPEARLAQDLVRAVRNRTSAVRMLLEREPWDALFVVYTCTDQAQHSFWHYLPDELSLFSLDAVPPSRKTGLHNPILDVYREIDAGIGQILQATNEEAIVLVLSDHGAGPLEQFFHLNTWLAQHGYLAYRTARKPLTQQMITLYAQTLPQPVRRIIRRALGRRFTEIKEVLETSALLNHIDWSRTRAYALGSGDIYLNVRGREPGGVVAQSEEYERLRDEIVRGLEKMLAPNGSRLAERVVRREDAYSGRAFEHAADLTMVLADNRITPMGRFSRTNSLFESSFAWRFDARPLTGGHTREGAMILAGPGIARGGRVEGARLVDMAPTLLGLLGIPLPASTDGIAVSGHTSSRAVTGSPGISHSASVGGDPPYSLDERKQIEHRLEDLGYL